MSQRDLVAELRAARITAPAEVRERIRMVVASDTSVRAPRFTWRRALVVALPVGAAVAATIVFTRPPHHATAVPDTLQVQRGAIAHGATKSAEPVRSSARGRASARHWHGSLSRRTCPSGSGMVLGMFIGRLAGRRAVQS